MPVTHTPWKSKSATGHKKSNWYSLLCGNPGHRDKGVEGLGMVQTLVYTHCCNLFLSCHCLSLLFMSFHFTPLKDPCNLHQWPPADTQRWSLLSSTHSSFGIGVPHSFGLPLLHLWLLLGLLCWFFSHSWSPLTESKWPIFFSTCACHLGDRPIKLLLVSATCALTSPGILCLGQLLTCISNFWLNIST